MRSHKRRIEKLEDKTINHKEDVPQNLQEIYAWEDSEKGQKALNDLYTETKKFNPDAKSCPVLLY